MYNFLCGIAVHLMVNICQHKMLRVLIALYPVNQHQTDNYGSSHDSPISEHLERCKIIFGIIYKLSLLLQLLNIMS
jgi:hypothetical protein